MDAMINFIKTIYRSVLSAFKFNKMVKDIPGSDPFASMVPGDKILVINHEMIYVIPNTIYDYNNNKISFKMPLTRDNLEKSKEWRHNLNTNFIIITQCLLSKSITHQTYTRCVLLFYNVNIGVDESIDVEFTYYD